MAVNPKYKSAEDETLDRLRRIETRLSRYMAANGFDTEVAKAAWSAQRGVVVPNINISLKEVLAAVPDYMHDQVTVSLRDGTVIAFVSKRN